MADRVKQCEKEYPQTCAEFKKIQKEQYELFCRKQLDYGPGNISVGTQLQTVEERKMSLTGIWFRVSDKINRMKQLLMSNKGPAVEGETIEDTLMDLSNYGIIAMIVTRKKWGK